jgi:hypothetical protein
MTQEGIAMIAATSLNTLQKFFPFLREINARLIISAPYYLGIRLHRRPGPNYRAGKSRTGRL